MPKRLSLNRLSVPQTELEISERPPVTTGVARRIGAEAIIASTDQEPSNQPNAIDDDVGGEYDFGYLFGEKELPKDWQNFARVESEHGRPENDLEYARKNISKLMLNDAVGRIMEKHLPKGSRTLPADELVDLVYGSGALQGELEDYFLDEIKSPDRRTRLPWRIESNTSKTPNHAGYSGSMSSQTYVAKLMVKMVDGEFRVDKSEKDGETRNKIGEIELGQHRAAARQMLDYLSSNMRSM